MRMLADLDECPEEHMSIRALITIVCEKVIYSRNVVRSMASRRFAATEGGGVEPCGDEAPSLP
jgi:hypothetical protein